MVTKATKKPTDEDVKVKKATTPWKPASIIEIPASCKDSGFEYYCATTNRTGNIEKKIAEGWEIDYWIAPKMREQGLTQPTTIQDGKSVDNTTRFRELIVMRMPKELLQSRRKYHEKKSAEQLGRVQGDFDARLEAVGSKSYGEIKTDR